MALQTARLITVKSRSGYDFSFQPGLDRNRVLALAKLEFIDRPLGGYMPAGRVRADRASTRGFA